MNHINSNTLDSFYERYKNTNVFSCLNGMRCISIVYVIWHHIPRNDYLLPMFTRGFLGVDIFFIISGFLISTLLLREREKTGSISLKNFWFRRFLRIFPIYYTMLGIFTLFYLFIKPHSVNGGIFFSDLPYLLSYTTNWHHSILGITWSLSAEEQFYFFWPLVLNFASSSALLILGLFLIFNQFVNFGFLYLLVNQETLNYLKSLEMVQITFTPMCLGIFLAYILHHQKSFCSIYYFLGSKWCALIFTAVLLVLVNFPLGDISGIVRLIIQVFSALLIGSVVIQEKNMLSKILTLKIVNRIGMVSYGMYLYHLIILALVLNLFSFIGISNTFVVFLITLMATYLFSELSYNYYEMQFLKLKSKYKSLCTT